MISSLNPSTQQFLNNLDKVTDQMQTAETQLASGLRVNQVSDAPDQISTILETRANLSATQQINSNLGQFTTEANAGQQALQTAVQLFDQVQTVASQADSGTTTPGSQATYSQELSSILQQLVGLANTSSGGRYIFAGDSDQTEPYTIDTTQNPPVVSAYLGSDSTREAQNPDGSTFPVGLTAQTIFDASDPASNVFSSVEGLISALNTNDSTALQSAVTGLSAVGTYLNQQLSFYGNTQQTLQQATDDGQTLETQLQTDVSNLEDADSASAIEQLTQAQTQEQAALQARALIPRTTLFDFLG